MREKSSPGSVQPTLAFSLTALIFDVPANFFPFMTIEMSGRRNSATIWSGVVDLSESGAWFVAAVVFLASIVIPLLKILALLYLAATAGDPARVKSNRALHRAIETIGRWSMLDIFLLAVLVSLIKLGRWATVEPEIGSVMFLFVVIFTSLASTFYGSAVPGGKDESLASTR